MIEPRHPEFEAEKIVERAGKILDEHLQAGFRIVDRMFAVLLPLEWIASIIVAFLVSPLTWSGEYSNTHVHVWAALFLGGATISLPMALTLARAGDALTRHCVAAGQMLLVALLIHLSGGRPETHFFVFVSLAYLALYRDWRVLVTASLVVAIDHYLRGIYWPRSVFGILAPERWRWAEHSLWVVFEDVVLTFGVMRSLRVIREGAWRQAEVEATRDRVELVVAERTVELRAARDTLEDRVRDRTAELERANEELRASEKRFRTLAEALPQIVWVADERGFVEYFNARWHEHTGASADESLEEGWLRVIHPEDLARTREVWGQAVTSGSCYQIEYRLRSGADGSHRWHLGRGLPLLDEDGSIGKWFGTCTDIDDQKRAAESLRKAHDELEDRVRERTADLERANESLLVEVAERRRAESEALRSRETAEAATRVKSEFLANMSHEIRTPMNAIIGMTELTLGMDLPAPQRENLEVVRVAADALLELIDDILDFSKIEAGKLDLDPIRFHPRESIDAALKTLSLRASGKGITLSGVVSPDVPEVLIGDPHRLRQVLLNLLGNAIKFAEGGQVLVRVGVEESVGGKHLLRFSVSDEGIGIPASRLAMIFDPFSQADGSTTRRFGGTGLGLSISSRLVELLGGRIWVESEVGRGSTFHFTALLEAASARQEWSSEGKMPGPSPSRSSSPRRRLRVLLVDDNELNLKVGALLVKKLGHEVRCAVDGPDAVSRYETEGPFDLVLIDVQMPGMDGFEATAMIRSIQGRLGRRVPIVAQTAFAMNGDRERCLRAGMDEYLAKPIRLDDLSRLIEGFYPEGDHPIPKPAPPWCLDPDEIRMSLALDDSEMAKIVGIFRESCAMRSLQMREAIIEGDPSTLTRAAHGLAGCLGIFASEATVALLIELEAAGHAGELARASATLTRLERAIGRMQPTLDRLADGRSRDGSARLMVDHPLAI